MRADLYLEGGDQVHLYIGFKKKELEKLLGGESVRAIVTQCHDRPPSYKQVCEVKVLDMSGQLEDYFDHSCPLIESSYYRFVVRRDVVEELMRKEPIEDIRRIIETSGKFMGFRFCSSEQVDFYRLKVHPD